MPYRTCDPAHHSETVAKLSLILPETNILVEGDYASFLIQNALLGRKMPLAGEPATNQLVIPTSPPIPTDFCAGIAKVIESLIIAGHPDVQTASEIVGLNTRTLQRRLSEMGTSFTQLVAETRIDIALCLIREENRPLGDCRGRRHALARAAAEAKHGRPVGQAIEAENLNFSMVSNHESSPNERALGLCWVLHIVGDMHQPLHVSDLYSADFSAGNAAGTLSYVADPMGETTIPLHMLWDSNVLRTPSLEVVDRAAGEFREKYPRSSFPELASTPVNSPDFFRKWARESHQVAVDWAYGIETVPDPNSGQSSEELVKNMVNFILNGVSPVDEAPEVPAVYWEQLQATAERRITLAGYRTADLVLAAADDIEAQRKFVGR